MDQQLNLTREMRQRQKIDDDVVSAICDVIVISPTYGRFGAIRKPDSGRMVHNF